MVAATAESNREIFIFLRDTTSKQIECNRFINLFERRWWTSPPYSYVNSCGSTQRVWAFRGAPNNAKQNQMSITAASDQTNVTTDTKTLMNLETKFWQSMVDQDSDSALQWLHYPALMASSQGAMKFDHAGYRKMAEQGAMVVTAFALSDMEVMFASETTAVVTYRVKQTVAARAAPS